jgi:probable HAF family extracellular repeat protein
MSSPVVAAAVAAGFSLLVLPAAQAQTAPPREIGTLGGGSSWAQAINALGAVVGTSETPEGSFRAFIARRPGALTGLGPDNVPGVGLGINDLNDVVGSSDRAFARIGGRLRELGPGLANDISNLRQSAGWSACATSGRPASRALRRR